MAAALSYFLTQIYFNQDRMDQALAAAIRGRQLAWQTGDALIAGLCGHGILQVYFQIGNYELAQVAGHAALVDAQKARYRTAETRALLAAIASHLGRRKESRMQFRLALEEARRLKDLRLMANLEEYFAARLLNWGAVEEARGAAERSYAIRQKINLDLAWSNMSLAKIQLASQRPGGSVVVAQQNDWEAASGTDAKLGSLLPGAGAIGFGAGGGSRGGPAGSPRNGRPTCRFTGRLAMPCRPAAKSRISRSTRFMRIRWWSVPSVRVRRS